MTESYSAPGDAHVYIAETPKTDKTDKTKWHSEYRSAQDIYVVTAPSGFRFFFRGLDGILEAIAHLVRRGSMFHTALEEPVMVSASGVVTIVQGDPWENNGFTHNIEVTNAVALADTLLRILKEHYNG